MNKRIICVLVALVPSCAPDPDSLPLVADRVTAWPSLEPRIGLELPGCVPLLSDARKVADPSGVSVNGYALPCLELQGVQWSCIGSA